MEAIVGPDDLLLLIRFYFFKINALMNFIGDKLSGGEVDPGSIAARGLIWSFDQDIAALSLLAREGDKSPS